MESKPLVELLRIQMARLVEIATEEKEKLIGDEAGKPSDGLDFAEFLLLCPTEDAARQRMRQDQKGAIAFLQLAGSLTETIGQSGIPSALQNLQPNEVQDYLLHLRKHGEDVWQ